MGIREIYIIAEREVRSFFTTPLGYFLLASFSLISVYFFFTLLQYYNQLSIAYQAAPFQMADAIPNLIEDLLEPYFRFLMFLLLFVLPLLTMRLFAEERRSGTFELLLIAPISTFSIVLGKFFGTCILVLVLLLLSFLYPLFLLPYVEGGGGIVLSSALGILLFSFGMTSIAMAVGAITESQLLGAVLGITTLLLFALLDAPVTSFGSSLGSLLSYLTPRTHTDLMIRGVLESSSLVYFLSIIYVGIFVTIRLVEGERWR